MEFGLLELPEDEIEEQKKKTKPKNK